MHTTVYRALLGALLGLGLTLTSACGGGGPSVADAAKAGAVAKRIAADPAAAAPALAEAGLTEAELNALLFEIAADPALSKAYADAMR
jgi:hypothetical protein